MISLPHGKVHAARVHRGRVRDPGAFAATIFLGLARSGGRDPYRLELLGEHLDADENPLALLEIRGGTLLVTDARVLELRPHLDVHGAWNVQEFRGYAVHQSIPCASVRDVNRETRPSSAGGPRDVDEVLRLGTADSAIEILVSRAPAPTLETAEVEILRDAILAPHAK